MADPDPQQDQPAMPEGVDKDRTKTTERERDNSVMDLRTFMIMMTSLCVAIVMAIPAGLAAAGLIASSPVAAGLVAGIAVFFTAFLGTMAKINALVEHER